MSTQYKTNMSEKQQGQARPVRSAVHVTTAHAMSFPPKLDLKGNLSTNWRKFKRVRTNYEIASGLNLKEEAVRVATF